MSLASRVVRCAPLVAWLLVITYWSDQTRLPIDEPAVASLLMGLQHRLAHLVAFGALAVLAWWAFEGWPRRALLVMLVTAVFAAFDEWHQSWVPGRRGAVDDWVFDLFSAGLVVWLWPRLRGRRAREL